MKNVKCELQPNDKKALAEPGSAFPENEITTEGLIEELNTALIGVMNLPWRLPNDFEERKLSLMN